MAPAASNGLNIGKTGLNIIFHIQDGQLRPFSLPGNVHGGPQNGPKMMIFCPKSSFLAIIGHFWGLLGPPGPFSWGQKGPNWPSWMWDTLFNCVQPMFNPFEAAGTTYGQIWQFLAEMAIFGAVWGPPGPFSWGQKGPNWPPQMWNTMFNRVQPMFNPFEAAGTILSDLWPEMAIFSSFLVTGGPFLGNLMGTRLNIS